jgi:23S rRNA pseudouridine1911/1915/1917 synthase
MEQIHHEIAIPDELDGKRLDQALAMLLPDYSRSRLKAWILDGNVQVDGAGLAPKTRVKAGQQVKLTATPEIQEDALPESMDLRIVYEDDAVLVIDKPAGLVVHPGAGNAAGTLMNGLLHHAPELAALPRSGILHRLDKGTTGLLLVTKTIPAHTRLVRALQDREITREYRGICIGRLTAGGTIDAPIGRHRTQRTRMAVVERGGRPAITHYRVLDRFSAHTFVAIRLDTGRTHQIRVHMAHQRQSLVCDPDYGGRLKIPAGASASLAESLRRFSRQALHACRLEFTHPESGATVSLQAPLPEDFVYLLQTLSAERSKAGNPSRWDQMTWPQPLQS